MNIVEVTDDDGKPMQFWEPQKGFLFACHAFTAEEAAQRFRDDWEDTSNLPDQGLLDACGQYRDTDTLLMRRLIRKEFAEFNPVEGADVNRDI